MARSTRLLRSWTRFQVYHVFQRGNRRQPVFPTQAAYRSYLHRLFLLALRYKVRVHAFCLLPNHVHLVLEITRKAGLSAFMRDLQSGHARWLHTWMGTDGHAWKHHYGCKPVSSESYYRTLLWYVEVNPVRAGLVRQAGQWRWSSAAAHLGGGGPLTLSGKGQAVEIRLWTKRWRQSFAGVDWAGWLRSPAEAEQQQRLREIEDIYGVDRPRWGSTVPLRRPSVPRRRPLSLRLVQPLAMAVGQSRAPDPPPRKSTTLPRRLATTIQQEQYATSSLSIW